MISRGKRGSRRGWPQSRNHGGPVSAKRAGKNGSRMLRRCIGLVRDCEAGAGLWPPRRRRARAKPPNETLSCARFTPPVAHAASGPDKFFLKRENHATVRPNWSVDERMGRPLLWDRFVAAAPRDDGVRPAGIWKFQKRDSKLFRPQTFDIPRSRQKNGDIILDMTNR
jgi:hypothetical protein